MHAHRNLGALDDELELDLLCGGLKDLGHSRERRDSADPGLMPHHHRDFGRRAIEERVYAGPDVDELLLHEERDRRMLQLRMGRNYGDHLAVHGIGIGEPMVPRSGRLPHISDREFDI